MATATWDAAVSFVGADVRLASQIADRLRGRVNVWIYPEHQPELVGDRGVTALSRVFGHDTSLVVVLHRGTWGETDWTSIERDAIEDRRLRERRNDFVMFVRMDNAPLPQWAPRSRIYGTGSLSADDIAAAVEHWVTERGGRVRPETAADMARRLDAAAARTRERESFLFGPSGWGAGQGEAGRVLARLQETAAGYGCTYNGNPAARRADVRRDWFIATVAARSGNPGVELVVQMWRGEVIGNSRAISIYAFDFEPPSTKGWRRDGSGPFLSSDQLADEVIKELLKTIEADRQR